jgi:spore maturation protein CgeB
MKVVVFCHSLVSDWNHGNAHFLRGVTAELLDRGHDVHVLEPRNAWSRANLAEAFGRGPEEDFARAFPSLASTRYELETLDVDAVLDGADLVLVHEWSDPALVRRIGEHRSRTGGYRLLFHDTHHRAVSAPREMRAYDLSAYDGVLAFGATLARVYEGWGWGNRVHVWHEAADTRRFRPPAQEPRRAGLVWIGNWGDGERSAEIVDFLLKPAKDAALPLDVYGVRYPDAAQQKLQQFGARYHGWTANAAVPELFASHLATVHVPRRFYTRMLPGIPTIRMFEALACCIPLVSAPWDDCERLFRVDQDFLMISNGGQMSRALRDLKNDAQLRAALARSGLDTILKRHTCAHRADELLAIVQRMRAPALEPLLESAA